MDKYTVDLDKVLNDFEYSELTDQYNVSREKSTNYGYLSQNLPTTSQRQQDMYRLKSTPVKHSITNVFHSLNEYLNTDISAKKPQDIKDRKDNNTSKLQESGSTTVSEDSNELKPTSYEDYVKEPSLVSNTNFSSDEGDLLLNTDDPGGTHVVPLVTNTSYNAENWENVQNGTTDSILCDISTNSCEYKLENDQAVVHKEGDSCTQPLFSKFVVDNIITNIECVKSVVEIPADVNDEQSSTFLSNLEVQADEDGSVIANNNTGISNVDQNYVMVGQVLAEQVEDVFKEFVNNDETHTTENLIESVVEEIPDNQMKDTTESNTDGASDPKEKLVGFDPTFEIDDSDLNRYLEDLEDEYESQNKDEITQKLVDSEEEARITNTVGDTLKKETDKDAVVIRSDVPEIHVDTKGETKATNSEEACVEVLEKEVDSSAVKSSESFDVLEREKQEREMAVETNLRGSVQSRPRSLSLNNETEDVKPKINLIGEPGSTPYNNLYVEKELPASKSKLAESETESSPSISPAFTLSETASITSSTDSIADSLEDKEKYAPTKTTIDVVENNENLENQSENMSTIVNDNNSFTQQECDNVSNNNVRTTSEEDGLGTEANLVCNVNNNSGDEVRQELSDGVDADLAAVYEFAHEDGANAIERLDINLSGSSIMHVPEQNAAPDGWLGKQAPLWIPDSEALNCLHCDIKFTVIKRRHHCRACGLVLCSKCCSMKYKLEYLDAEARVCLKCYDILIKDTNSVGSEGSPVSGNSQNRQLNQPNPNNPMEYCSVVPPLQQVGSTASQAPPTVMVPVGVLKRKGSGKSRTNKSVMFCDGIRPGSELTNLDSDFNYSEPRTSNTKKIVTKPTPKTNRNIPALDPQTNSFIPAMEGSLPPTVTIFKSDISYTECSNNANVVEMLKNESLTFALQSNLYVHVKVINMECCIHKWAWCFSTEGLIAVGQDEIVVLVEIMENEKTVPKDMFLHLNNIYTDAKKGSSITEHGISLHNTSDFLGSKNHIGFLYIRPSFQCLKNVICPKEPYLIGILIHRWEMPWAKIFPLRLVLRLGAEYRYYPSPIISTRHRESVFVEIGHTIINLLADFRNFSYTLPNIRGLSIHMEDKNTTVTIPSNRYDQVMKSLNNSSDHILAFGGNFSLKADSHLVCIQDTQGNNENTYTTHAINIHNRPRKVTGASFIVFNGALKSTSGLTAKSSIVEDGLMIQIPSEHMLQIRESLRNMKNHTIQCGCVNATSDETVSIVWGDNDVNFNMGVTSSVDNQPLSGIPSIRVHNGKDYVCNSGNRMIRWTEVFILQNREENTHGQEADFSKLAESVSIATCQALVKYLDLLASNNFYKIGIRTTLHVENVSYSAGSNGMKLPPIYMKSLDNELIPILHRITSNNLGESSVVLELIFRILNV